MSVWNALTVDVEDWFHVMEIAGGPGPEAWRTLESRVEANTDRVLAMLDAHGVRGSFFVLGWVAEHYGAIVERIRARGHEIGSHGYGHAAIFRQTEQEFRADLARSIAVIDGVAGARPVGYRAPGFSVVPSVTWAFDALADFGFRYDSSLTPARRFHGGWLGTLPAPHRIVLARGRELAEFPISTIGLGRLRVPFLGGGYLRAFPLAVSLAGLAMLNARGVPGILYVHPRDLDGGQPRLTMPAVRRFASYTGLESCASKLRALLSRFRFTTVSNALEDYFSKVPARVWCPAPALSGDH